MNVLNACEESQAVCKAFRAKGHNAFSCDIIECSGGHPEWHIQQDVLPLLNGNCEFTTMDGQKHKIDGQWDLIIAHPPCTYLTISGNKWFNVEKYGEKALQRFKDREAGANFFMQFVNAQCDKIVIENPVGYMSTHYRKPDQIIQPYEYGHPTKKQTCLWLKNVPLLIPTEIVAPEVHKFGFGEGFDVTKNERGKQIKWSDPETARARSKTFPGIAKAMADQWG